MPAPRPHKCYATDCNAVDASATDTRKHRPRQRIRVLPIFPAGYHQKVWCRPIASSAIVAVLAVLAAPAVMSRTAQAQPHLPPPREIAPAPSPYPGFWDPKRRPERPDLSRLSQIRFMTETRWWPSLT